MYFICYLDQRKADEQEIPQGCTTVFVKNLPYDITEEELGQKFKPCGEIKSIRFVYNTSHNHFKGY
jgi:nucleolin